MPDQPHQTSTRREHLTQLLRAAAALPAAAWLAGCASSQPGSRAGDPIPDSPIYRPLARRPAPRTGAVPRSGGVGPAPGVIARSHWTDEQPVLSLADRMGSIESITVHHEGSDAYADRTWGGAVRRLRSIREAHRGREWADIGYHYAIDPAGRVWEARPLSLQGAHVRDHNPHNIGIVLLGNFERQQPTPDAVTALDRLIAAETRRHGLRRGSVRTHREYAPTLCPGRSLQAHMDIARARGGSLAAYA